MPDETTPDELAELLDEEDVTVLDIRDAHAYRQGHIPGTDSLPLNDMDDDVLGREWPARIVLIDYDGEVAPSAASKLTERLDAQVSALAGGMSSWDGELEADF